MTKRWSLALLATTALVQSAWLAAGPQPVDPVRPVPLVAACATELAARVADVGVLGCDPTGRGRAVLALGDPATAAHVVVLVPGSDIDLTTLDDPLQPQRRPLGWARALASATGPDTAVVLWVGYPTPRGLGVDAATGRLARAAAPALVQQVDALRQRPGPPPTTTVVGHSYGAVVVALAAPELQVDDVVLVASPGARAESVAALDSPARVWAARAADDWIRRVPGVAVGDLGHGPDPTDPAFGARLLPAGDTRDHADYFRPGSQFLAALADVVRGAGVAR
ncbi:alpha/beta hydrolase [Modestobacter italicus]|uniref:alpha/beta hydrolase n=1 Tax=Modestobacter italicus (strain DSM 44449 / CECT 9708 / BC 501) TaxID=2732864 RepID=UPI001C975DCE|nr:alpha/beta hydrolase [Modestobacter italicus]